MPATIKIIGALSKETIVDGSYRESGATALQVDGTTDATGDIVITDDINLAVAGSYTITYTLPEASTGEVAGNIVETRSLEVIAPVGVIDTTFDLGDETRRGEDISGSGFDKMLDAVDNDPVTNPLPAQASAYFSETAMDPYERKHSK